MSDVLSQNCRGAGGRDISEAMQSVTSALAKGHITPGEAGTMAAVVETFALAIETTRRRGFAVDPLQILALGDYDETDGYDDDNETDEDMKLTRIMKLRIAIREKGAGRPTSCCRESGARRGRVAYTRLSRPSSAAGFVRHFNLHG